MTAHHRHPALILLLALLLSGCTDWLQGQRPPPQTPHDLGWLPPPSAIELREVPLLAVDAPPWLNDLAVRYRQSGTDETALHSYPDDQWLAAPRELLLDRLQQTLLAAHPAAADPQSPRYRLEVRLLRFEQEYTGPSATAVVALQAVLKEPRGRRQWASPLLEGRVASATGPAGAVRGLGQATDQAIGRLLAWLGETQLRHAALAEPSP